MNTLHEPPQKTILIVDDEYDILMSLELLFSMEGFKVLLTYNGKQAIESLQSTPYPDVILSDIMMPELDGYELLKAVKANPKWDKIPFILTSAAPLNQARMKETCLVPFVSKPFDIFQLLSTIEEAMKAAHS